MEEDPRSAAKTSAHVRLDFKEGRRKRNMAKGGPSKKNFTSLYVRFVKKAIGQPAVLWTADRRKVGLGFVVYGDVDCASGCELLFVEVDQPWRFPPPYGRNCQGSTWHPLRIPGSSLDTHRPTSPNRRIRVRLLSRPATSLDAVYRRTPVPEGYSTRVNYCARSPIVKPIRG